MNKKIISVAVIAAVVVVGILLVMRGGTSSPAPESPKSTMPVPDEEPSQFMVAFTDAGFSPSSLVVPAGAPVVFKNNGTRGVWVASNPHPVHTGYPGSDIENCGAGTEMFDSCRVLNPGESWTLVFEELGAWGFHNHLQSSQTGTIIVELSK